MILKVTSSGPPSPPELNDKLSMVPTFLLDLTSQASPEQWSQSWTMDSLKLSAKLGASGGWETVALL